MTDDAEAWIPEVVGDWWQIAGNPDLGKYQTERQEPLDFGIWQAADGTWQLWSCVRYTGCGGKTRLFYRWEGQRLTDKDWRPMGIAMEADPNFGETEGGLQAPYVLRKGDGYYMFYGDWVNICLAKSWDGKTFARHLNADGLSGLFSEKPGTSSRDPMVMACRNKYYIYYTGVPGGKGAIYCRTSTDLLDWGESTVVSSGGIGGDGPASAECAFVYYLPHDFAFYFFRAHPVKDSDEYATAVYRSENPLDFGVDSDEYLVGSLPFEVVRIIKDGPDFYLTALNPDYDGIRLARMKWVPIKK
ncbi:MAG: hypothetical protein PVH84_02855 [Candidatus Aminicenantes bacterium]|jgi:hypothetical protein